MWESSETFEAYATIDSAFVMLRFISEEMSQSGHSIHSMIDEATGYDKVVNKQFAAEIKPVLEDLIKAKKAINWIPHKEVSFLNYINELLETE